MRFRLLLLLFGLSFVFAVPLLGFRAHVQAVSRNWVEVGGGISWDVAPVNLIILLEGGRLRDGCWFELYKKVRPLKNGNNCAKNPR